MLTKDRFLRKLFPSVAVFARSPVARVLDIFDSFIKRKNPEWQQLPPASVRMRIGVGNHILRNHQYFIDTGNYIVTELREKGYLNPDSHVIELGCGCGRNALAFSKYLSEKGRYIGQDVDREMLGWCKKNLQSQNVTFYDVDVFSTVYNPKGKPITDYKLPADDNSIDLIFSISVFSHLIYGDTAHYIRESARVLKKGGHIHLTLFIIDFLRERLGDRWTFSHKVENYYVENLKYPEAAVAYDLETIEALMKENGLRIVEIYNKEMHQQTIIAVKE